MTVRSDVSIPDLKIIKYYNNKCIKANTTTIWQHMLHIPPTKYEYSAPNLSQKTPNKQEPHKRAYLSKKWRFRDTEVRRMGQKHKRITQKEQQDKAEEQKRI